MIKRKEHSLGTIGTGTVVAIVAKAAIADMVSTPLRW